MSGSVVCECNISWPYSPVKLLHSQTLANCFVWVMFLLSYGYLGSVTFAGFAFGFNVVEVFCDNAHLYLVILLL